METVYHYKLVRDLILSRLTRLGVQYRHKILSKSEYRQALWEKLGEETREAHRAKSRSDRRDELADILEVLYALSEEYGIPFEEIEDARRKKHKECGGFLKKIFLISTTE